MEIIIGILHLLTDVIKITENKLGKIKIKKTKLQAADVIKTHGSNQKLKNLINFKKFSNFNESLEKVISWSEKYYLK